MIRVLHYIGTLELGGSQSFVMELYRNLDRTKIQFDFVVFQGWRGPLYDEIKSFGGEIYDSPKYSGINHLHFVHWWNQFLLTHPEYKVIHGHVRSVASIYLPIARRHDRYTILHSHSLSNGTGIKGMIKYILQWPVRFQANYYMACSDEAGTWLFGGKVVRGKRYRTVPNAINAQKYAYKPEVRERIRREYSLEHSLVIGHVGRFCDVKNQEFLLNILAEMVKSSKNVKMILVGDGPDKEVIEQRCFNMGLSEYIIFTGARLDVEHFYQAMDVFVFPSKWEGLGIAAIEAQASGLPCVISDKVPQSVDVKAGLIKKLSLKDGVERWAVETEKACNIDRRDRIEEVRQSGFDIHDSSKKMEMFYIKAANTARHRELRSFK